MEYPGSLHNRPRSQIRRYRPQAAEKIEQPIKSRLTQIGAGLGIQATAFETGLWIVKHTHSDLFADVSHPSELMSTAIPLYLTVTVLGLFVLSTLVGGGAAGAWCINWALQGVGVGAGFLARCVRGPRCWQLSRTDYNSG